MVIPKRILEKRRAVRVDENLHFQFGYGGYEIQAVTINISASGAMCLVDSDIPLLTRLKIKFPLSSEKRPRKKNIDMEGVVVRKQKDTLTGRFYLAIFFSRVNDEDRKALEGYLHERLVA